MYGFPVISLSGITYSFPLYGCELVIVVVAHVRRGKWERSTRIFDELSEISLDC